MTRLFAGTDWDQPPRCQRCDQLESACQCPPPAPPPKRLADPTTQTARLAIEKRKRGKLMTVVRGLSPADNDLAALLTQLKTECGAGGTIKEELLEIQGKHLERIRGVLQTLGYRVQG
jgi:translation initiation factor 1